MVGRLTLTDIHLGQNKICKQYTDQVKASEDFATSALEVNSKSPFVGYLAKMNGPVGVSLWLDHSIVPGSTSNLITPALFLH
jgi:hypothetical protein